MSTHEAPNLPRPASGRGSKSKTAEYPGKGVKTGPCWRAMWAVLSDAPGPIWLEHLGRIGAAAGACSPQTAWLLADLFRRAGTLSTEKELIGSRWRLVYARTDRNILKEGRVTPEWLAEWCEKSGNPRLQGIEFP